MKAYFAYVRVSTVKQGERGSSLQEQRDAIKSFAARHNLRIASWFEERETAAKIGRREFSRMVSALKKYKAAGVIFHKIDRSARNLRDWSAVQELADVGIDVRFTQESINLASNEGKLTGDFLAVISAHYIRNLREEVTKGMRGRLKQGLYPWNAPIGYLNMGGGRPKVPDPVLAPFVREAFELYATGRYSLHTLSDALYERGLRSKAGNKVDVNRLSVMLRNPFYAGVIRVNRTKECFPGEHEPLISPSTFELVQRALDGKLYARPILHEFLLRRMIACTTCGYHLIGELQKGNVYYRCHTRTCPTCSVREDTANSAISDRLGTLDLTDDELSELRSYATSVIDDRVTRQRKRRQSIELQVDNLDARMSKLLDAYLEGAIDRSIFEEKKLTLLLERKRLEEQRHHVAKGQHSADKEILSYLELLKSLVMSYQTANSSEKREILKIVTSNLRAQGKNVVVELRSPFREIANLTSVSFGGHVRHRPRTALIKIIEILLAHCERGADIENHAPKENQLPLAA